MAKKAHVERVAPADEYEIAEDQASASALPDVEVSAPKLVAVGSAVGSADAVDAPKKVRKPRGPSGPREPVVILETVDASPEPKLRGAAAAINFDTLHQGQRRTLLNITKTGADKAAQSWARAYCPTARFLAQRAPEPKGAVWLFRLVDAPVPAADTSAA